MKQLPTLEELKAQLDAQNAELAELTELADVIPHDVTIDPRALAAFDEHIDALPSACSSQPVHCGIRA